jgi:uncharacterized membrane protein
MNKQFKIAGVAVVFLLMAVVLMPSILAQNFTGITEVKINGDVAQNGDDLYVERGDDLVVRVTIDAASGALTDAYLQAFISGYRYAYYEPNLISDFSKTFTLPEGNKRTIEMNLKVPMDMETKDAKLRIVLFDENSASIITYNYQLSINGAEDNNAVEIRDFFVSPSSTIEAGKPLSFKVKVKNFGLNDLDDLKVKVAIPELNIQTFETIDTLEKDETQSFEALVLRIPQDTKPGDYNVVATVEYDRYQQVEQTLPITVIAAKGTPCSGDTCNNGGVLTTQTVVTMPASVDVVAGTQGSVYPILVENKGSTSKTYVLSVSGVSDWGTAVFEPSSVFVLKAGQSQTVYLRLTALKNAALGDKVMKVTITAGDEMKDTTVIASVKEGTSTSGYNGNVNTKNVLEWLAIALVILLLILGVVLIFRKLGKEKGKEEEQSYY